MKKISLSLSAVFAVLSVLIFPACKKSSTDDAAAAVTPLTAIINGTAWTPDTLSANINYNAATKTKTLSFTGTIAQKRLSGSVALANSTASNTFATGSYPIDAAGTVNLLYSIQQKDSNGNYVFVPYVTATTADGNINITSINTAGNTISGNFYFTHKVTNYDANGNIVSISNNVISGGVISSMPYTYTSN